MQEKFTFFNKKSLTRADAYNIITQCDDVKKMFHLPRRSIFKNACFTPCADAFVINSNPFNSRFGYARRQ